MKNNVFHLWFFFFFSCIHFKSKGRHSSCIINCRFLIVLVSLLFCKRAMAMSNDKGLRSELEKFLLSHQSSGIGILRLMVKWIIFHTPWLVPDINPFSWSGIVRWWGHHVDIKRGTPNKILKCCLFPPPGSFYPKHPLYWNFSFVLHNVRLRN